MKSNTIGFNNFKSFGDKVQTFSQKPITLIYGPNSIGKSSLLHFLLYIEYLKESGEVSLEKSDFAGDQINLGGFNNFIHKKDIDKEITYQLTLNKQSDIEKYLPPLYSEIKKFEKDGAFKKEITELDIVERLKKYCKKDRTEIIIHKYIKGQYKFYSTFRNKNSKGFKEAIFSTYQYIDSDIQLELFQQLDNEFKEAHSKLEKKEILKEIKAIIDKQNISEQEKTHALKELMDSNDILLEEKIKNNDSTDFDVTDKLILYILDNKEIFIQNGARFEASKDFSDIEMESISNTIYMYIKQFISLINIKQIRLDFKLANKKEKSYRFNCYADQNLIFSYDSRDKQIKPNNDNNLFLEINDINSPSITNELYKNAYTNIPTNLFTPNTIDFSMNFPWEYMYGSPGLIRSFYNTIMRNLKQTRILNGVQYLGPLRYSPERYDMFQKAQENQDGKQSNQFYFTKKDILFISKYPFMKFLFVFKKGFMKTVFNSLTIQDAFNNFKKRENKISSGSAMNSKKTWLKFINSPDVQKNVNAWISDDSKLKTPYNIEVIKREKTSFFRKLFKLSPIESNQLVFIDKRTNTHVTPREMGLGISQLLPVLVATKMLEDHKIFIEQPELHLHPAVQCEIADEIIKSKNLNNNELIIETHSEHLLLRMMKRLRHTAEGIIKEDGELALTPDDICLLYVDNNGEFTYLNELELDDDGTLLDPWPNGFFEEGFNERFS